MGKAVLGDELAPGTILGRYEIRRQLGRGGMGAVYEATHRDLKKRVAVKVLMAALSANDEARQRFLREGEAAGRIRHPHVVDVTDVGTDGTLTYLVMEFLEGEDLATRLGRSSPLSPQETADIMLPVCAGVGAAHEEGVIHRDLKPENIFLSRSRHGGVHPMVLDFGVSKVVGGFGSLALTGTAATFGTPFYMPPEQLRGARQADQRSDEYALGVVLYECLTGRRPFEATENIYAMLRAIGDGEYPPPRAVFPHLPEAVEAVIVRAMALDPNDRYPTVRHLGSALLPFASEHMRMVWLDTFPQEDGSGRAMSPRTIELSPDAGRAPSAGSVPRVSASAPHVSGSAPRLRTGGGTGGGTGGSVSGTRILPSAPPPQVGSPSSRRFPSGTTLGSATGQQFERMQGRGGHKGIVFGSLLVTAAAAVGAYFLIVRPPDTGMKGRTSAASSSEAARNAQPETYRVEVESEPSNAILELDGSPVGTGYVRRDLPKDGRDHRLVARAAGYRDAVVRFTDEPPPPRLPLTLLAPEPAQERPVVTPPPDQSAGGTGRPSHPHKPSKPSKPNKPAKPNKPEGGGQPAERPPGGASPTGGPANGAPVID